MSSHVKFIIDLLLLKLEFQANEILLEIKGRHVVFCFEAALNIETPSWNLLGKETRLAWESYITGLQLVFQGCLTFFNDCILSNSLMVTYFDGETF